MSPGPKPLRARLRAIPAERFVRAACYLALASMLLMCWSVLDPRPLPVMMAMTVGQAGAVLAFVLYLVAMLFPHAEREGGGPRDDA